MKRAVHSKEAGFTLVTTAICLTLLFGIAGLAIDMGKLYLERTQLQHVADAAALAGAYTFLDISQPQPSSATAAAISIANTGTTIAGSVSITSANVTVQVSSRKVTVTIPQPSSGTMFYTLAKVAGSKTFATSAHATAQASPAAAGDRCLKPIFVPNSGIAPTGYSENQACAGPEPHTIFYPATDSRYGQLTTYAQTYLPSNANTEMVLRPTSPSVAAAPGQFYSINFGGGASTYSCALSGCLDQCGITQNSCGNSLNLKTGNMVGPTISGVDALIGNPPNDIWVAPSEYKSSSTGTMRDSSPALVTVPVFDDCSQRIKSGSNQYMKVIGYVRIFITKADHSQGGVYAHIVTANGCAATGSGSGVPSTSVGVATSTGPGGVPVQLVQ